MAKSTLPVNFKDDVLASSMGGKRRYRLIHNSDGTVSLEDATTYTQVGSNFGAAQVNATNAAVNASLATDGNASNVVNTFSQASARSNLSTGEKLSVSLGKIMKYFADLKGAAFRDVANNLTTSSAGSSVLDAYQGYLLNSNKVNNSNIIDTLADVIANTQSKKPAGSLALKSAYNELNGKLTDSGWIVAPSTSDTIKYRKKNGYVTVVGLSNNQKSIPAYSGVGGGGLKIFTLPAGYRPTAEVVTLGSLRTNDGYELQAGINTSGVIELINFGRVATVYWSFVVTYPV